MECRLDRLTRAAEIAETAQKQLLVVEARGDPGRITAGQPYACWKVQGPYQGVEG